MTNIEKYISAAIENYDSLDMYEMQFIDKVREYSKKELKGLTSKQFKFLRDVSSRF